MRVLVCGSRNWPDAGVIILQLARLPKDAVVVHGGARGADRCAGRAAAMYGLTVEEHPADWNRHGKRAGVMRNLEMLDSGIDLVLAFQCEGSRGTQHTIDEARRRGVPVEVWTT